MTVKPQLPNTLQADERRKIKQACDEAPRRY
jgi:hypothetical protein